MHAPKHLVPVGELAAWASSIKGIEGLTFSGGEPFEQASAVAEVIRIARKSKPELSVFVFTGYTLEEISSSHDKGVKSLLGMVDMLSAGRYESRKRDSTLLWRGSANQNLLYLTDRYGQEMESKWILESPIEEVHLMDSEIVRTGFLGVGGPLSRIINSWARSDP
jgi:organic radical activating enzyme